MMYLVSIFQMIYLFLKVATPVSTAQYVTT